MLDLAAYSDLADLILEADARAHEAAITEAARAEAEAAMAERFGLIAAELRAPYHPKEAAFCRSRAKRRAAKCTRRASKTHGVCRETNARALETKTRVLYCAATREEAKKRAWRTDSGDGWIDLLARIGLVIARTRAAFDLGTGDVLVNETELTIDFRNGSQLAIFAADRPEDADKLRGGQKDVIVVDEAQIFPALTYFVTEVCEAMLVRGPGMEPGELWLCGTPGRSLDGLFFDVTKEPDQGDRLQGWEVHEFAVTDNPYFGATAEERWEATAGKILRDHGWDPEDPPPEFVREYLGKWTSADALYVYAVHKYRPILFAPVRVDAETGIYNHAAALLDLPKTVIDERGFAELIDWYFTMGIDFGFSPDPFAWVLWAWSPTIAEVYEMGSWKKTELLPSQMKTHLTAVYAQVQGRLVSMRGDAGGALASAQIAEWAEVLKLPIEPAEKHNKENTIQLYNGEVGAGRIRYRVDSMLLVEQKHLQWKIRAPRAGEVTGAKKVEWTKRRIKDATGLELVPGNHCCDSGLYGVRDIFGRRVDFAAPPTTAADRLKLEHAAMVAAAERQGMPQRRGAR